MAAEPTPDATDLPDWMAAELAPPDLDLGALIPHALAEAEAPVTVPDFDFAAAVSDALGDADAPPPPADLDLAALIPDTSSSQFDLQLAALIPDVAAPAEAPAARAPVAMLPDAVIESEAAAPALPVPKGERPAPVVYGALVSLPTQLAALDVAVVHDVPPGLEVISTDPPSAAANGQLLWRFERVSAGQKLPIWVTVRPEAPGWQPPRDPVAFRLTFTSRGSVALPVARPALAAEVAGPTAVEAGALCEFVVRVRNSGNWPLRGVVAAVAPQFGFEAHAGRPLSFGDIAAGESASLPFALVACAAGRGVVRVGVAAPDEGVSATAEAECAVAAAELSVRVEGPASWRARRDHEVTVAVGNPGTAPARSVEARLELPAGWVRVGGDGSYDAASRTARARADRLAPGERLRMKLVVRPAGPGECVLRADAVALGLRAAAEEPATVRIEAADGEGLLERFVREVGFEADLPASPRAGAAVPARGSTRDHPHVVFGLAGTDYALPLGSVREVRRPPAITPIPGGPDWLAGVGNVRGDVVSMVDLRAFLDGSPAGPAADRRLVVVSTSGGELTAGLLVDRVRGLRSIPPADVRMPGAPLAGRSAPYMLGVAAGAGAPLVVLAPDLLLSSPELQPFGPG